MLLTVISAAQFKRVPLQAPANPNPQLYKADANAVQDIRRALATAGKQHKNVLLDFGGNWCIDCHILENAFHQPRIAPLLNEQLHCCPRGRGKVRQEPGPGEEIPR